MAQQLPLSQNQFVLVDDEDFPTLSRSRWSYRPERNGHQGYAVRTVKVDGKFRKEYLHRTTMNSPPGTEVIFLNFDKLDCRRENLRVVSKQEARQHHRVRRDSQSGVKGVTYNPESEMWTANVYRHGHCYRVGTYYSKEAAVAAYEQELRRENPDLHTAPKAVERLSSDGSFPSKDQRAPGEVAPMPATD